MGQHFQRGLKGNEVSGTGCLIADPSDQALQVINGI